MALTDDIKNAHGVADGAEAFRQDTRWNVKPGDPLREKQISDWLEAIRQAMVPIRAAAGRAVWGQLTASQDQKVREVSLRLQYQRKQLKKMRRP